MPQLEYPDPWEDPKSRTPNSGTELPLQWRLQNLKVDPLFGSFQRSGYWQTPRIIHAIPLAPSELWLRQKHHPKCKPRCELCRIPGGFKLKACRLCRQPVPGRQQPTKSYVIRKSKKAWQQAEVQSCLLLGRNQHAHAVPRICN